VAAERLATVLCGSAPGAALGAGIAGSVIVPVPAASRRGGRRGFDPAHLIATALGRRLGLGVELLLVRMDRGRQVGRPRSARIADPPRVVAPRGAPARVLIIDDVATTGATLRACAAALRDRGAEQVAAAVFARAV
jgi:predicted amidophosphoribosyltransferase